MAANDPPRVIKQHLTAVEIERDRRDVDAGAPVCQSPQPERRASPGLSVSARNADTGQAIHEPPALAPSRLTEVLPLPREQRNAETVAKVRKRQTVGDVAHVQPI